MERKIIRIKELIQILTQASKAYYLDDSEIMSNFEYDKLYDELVALEEETGMVAANSPTVQVGYEVMDNLPKEAHEKPMLSLGKTKDRGDLINWIQDNEGILSWKLDGLTIVLTYMEGKLAKAVTRGNGEIGEVITNNARVFKNIPLKIKYQGELILRGEAIITYTEFNKINEKIEDVDAKYKNPRNLCSGSVRQLNNEVAANRNVQFFAFSLVKADEIDDMESKESQFQFLKELGFDVVEYKKVNKENLLETIEQFQVKIATFDIPSDGLVLALNDIAYGKSLGTTAKFPRDSIAFKWEDELKETFLKEIEWSPSRTGLINPVAIFDPVELEGTTVSRASVHNISIMRALKLGIGDRITVYKANMIIPQIAENLTKSNSIEIPCQCPVCGGITQVKQTNDVQSLYCINPDCEVKKIKSFSLFVSRDGMNIEGLSEATLEKLIGKGFILEYADIYHLDRYQNKIETMAGFGTLSYKNLINSIEKSRKTTLPKVIYSLGIANIGIANAKMLCKECSYDLENILQASIETLSRIDGIGEVIAGSIKDFFGNDKNKIILDNLIKELVIEVEQIDEKDQILLNKTFVITGSLENFSSRNELKEMIEKLGGKVTGSVTNKTNYLINNDIASNSSKNKKAKELGIPILTEGDFIKEYNIDMPSNV
ncbi:MAG TPA: NAD-dependent DNA ligase LigA [Lachnospiraceae bacterium]|nr:NAD-dependent DNA ligase LigA [Lachnospiraceae bacterium]